MDPRILRYYNRELLHMREMGAEFAREHPKIAGRLGLEGFECADPYVERLLEAADVAAATAATPYDPHSHRRIRARQAANGGPARHHRRAHQEMSSIHRPPLP